MQQSGQPAILDVQAEGERLFEPAIGDVLKHRLG